MIPLFQVVKLAITVVAMHAFVPQETKGRESSVSTEDRFIEVKLIDTRSVIRYC